MLGYFPILIRRDEIMTSLSNNLRNCLDKRKKKISTSVGRSNFVVVTQKKIQYGNEARMWEVKAVLKFDQFIVLHMDQVH